MCFCHRPAYRSCVLLSQAGLPELCASVTGRPTGVVCFCHRPAYRSCVLLSQAGLPELCASVTGRPTRVVCIRHRPAYLSCFERRCLTLHAASWVTWFCGAGAHPLSVPVPSGKKSRRLTAIASDGTKKRTKRTITSKKQ